MVKSNSWGILGVALLGGVILFVMSFLLAKKNIGEHWKPSSSGEVLEVRDLPQADFIVQDYEDWLKHGTVRTVRVYEAIIQNAQQQHDFQWEVFTNNTPIPGFKMTRVSFRYKVGENNEYQVDADFSGAISENKFVVGEFPKRIWLQPVSMVGFRKPRMQLVAIEGLKADWIVSPTFHREVP